MSEDISATLRTGITVILVAALIAVIINLMGMGTSILNNGQSTLQSGISNVTTQEFSTYNGTNISGTQLTTCLNVFQDRDIAVLVVNAADASTIYNYNKQLNGTTAAAGGVAPKAQASSIMIDKSGTYLIAELTAATTDTFYRSFGNTAAVGNKEYINPSGRYSSKLIKDASGEIIGVCAIQYTNTGSLAKAWTTFTTQP